MKPIVYIDMDGVLVNFQSGIDKLSKDTQNQYKGELDNIPGIFSLMEPMSLALESIRMLSEKYNLYILSTAPWDNNTACSDKLEWIKKYFGGGEDSIFYKKVIFSHHKNLNKGDILIDDRLKNGSEHFEGEHIHYGTEKFPDWNKVVNYLMQ